MHLIRFEHFCLTAIRLWFYFGQRFLLCIPCVYVDFLWGIAYIGVNMSMAISL